MEEMQLYKINLVNETYKNNETTMYGILTINNITINPEKLQEYVSEIVLQEENLEFVFAKPIRDIKTHIRMLRLFLPTSVEADIENIIMKNLENNNNFYGFFAEALLAIAYRDLYGYQLAAAVLDINSTVVDSHTGVDACMFDENNEILLLGEAKFYTSLSKGFKKIIEDFTKPNGFFNKLSSFKKHCENNDFSEKIILKQLKKDELQTITLEDFLKLNIIYSGFVLHEHSGKVDKYLENDFYDDYNITVQQIADNVKNVLQKEIPLNHQITMIHLPIKDKQELIKMVIDNVTKQIGDMVDGAENR